MASTFEVEEVGEVEEVEEVQQGRVHECQPVVRTKIEPSLSEAHQADQADLEIPVDDSVNHSREGEMEMEMDDCDDGEAQDEARVAVGTRFGTGMANDSETAGIGASLQDQDHRFSETGKQGTTGVTTTTDLTLTVNENININSNTTNSSSTALSSACATGAPMATASGGYNHYNPYNHHYKASPDTFMLYVEECCRDHFTLNAPSSLVRFRPTAAARVFEDGTNQFILEETLTFVQPPPAGHGDDTFADRQDENANDNEENFDTTGPLIKRRLQVKSLSDGSQGLNFLRFFYSIICVFWTGIFFATCLEVLLVMVLEMAVATGKTEIEAGLHFVKLVGVMSGILVFTYGFAMCMVIATTFIHDAWTGHKLVKLFFFRNRYGNVLVDWIFFAFFLLFPVLVMTITLFARLTRWWEITMLFWYACISIFFVVFCFNVVFFEVKGAFSFLKKRQDLQGKSWLEIVKECILLRQRAAHSGHRTIKYWARSTSLDAIDDANPSRIEGWSRQEHMGLWARITRLSCLSRSSNANLSILSSDQPQRRLSLPIFSTVDPPQILQTIDDVQEHLPYVTKHTWSLERLFFRPRNSRYVAIVGGPGALTDHQMKSSVACSLIGILTFTLLIVGSLVWMRLPTAMIVAVVILCVIISIPIYKDTRRIIRMMRSIIGARTKAGNTRSTTTTPTEEILGPGNRRHTSKRESEIFLADESNDGIVLVTQKQRITLASDLLCWISLAFEISFLFILPATVLFRMQNYQLGCLFLLVGTVSGVRRYVNLLIVVEETGQLSQISGATTKIRWHKQSRLNVLITAISYNKSRVFWQLIFLGVGAVWVALFVSAAPSSTESIRTDQFTFVDGFSWTPISDDVRYESCEFKKANTFGENATLADYALLAMLPYKEDATAQSELGGWFRGVNVREDMETVSAFRSLNGVDRIPVFFRLFRFRLDNGLDRAVISIRGTVTPWDLLVDNQLWIAAMLIQGLRVLLPLGEMWTPILDELIGMMSFFQEGSVEQVSFYKVTTKFAIQLKNDDSFDSVQLTGHSLGGGIAMISSAQSKTPSVALSGPNAMLSGKSFDPSVSPDDLNRYTFNIIPDRDMVSRFDDEAQNYQRIRCTTEPHDFFGCHSAGRSFCEIVTTCGNSNRPAVCDCVFRFGYPVPIADRNDPTSETQSFEEACRTNGYVFPDS